ncbi:hypothetical protein CQW23_24368 [Capsicum baccatum]|uniref:F-box associated beta-propeller type 1 domain-containing protein n=1 Tax=Capsicum baccatum TaxID=33114 RepID=A0A2G2VUK6_CAPBA|nr:hypothetical protein CQW23_24368 [Capsicum baccatum]
MEMKWGDDMREHYCLDTHLNGKILYDWHPDVVILWNQDIRKSIILPNPRVHFGPYEPYMLCLGFRFDERKSEFKVVRIAYLQDGNGTYTILPPEVEVYSLSTGLWKTVKKDNRCRIVECVYSSFYLNGAIHWVSHIKNEGGDFMNRLLVFDLGDQRFSEMGLPKRAAHVSLLDLCVTLCGDQISVLWYAKGRNKGNGISYAIGFRRNGEFLVEKCVGHLLSYDPVIKEFKDLGIHGRKDSFFLGEYAESLVLLDGSSGATTDPSIASDSEEATGVHPQIQYTCTAIELLTDWGPSPFAARTVSPGHGGIIPAV